MNLLKSNKIKILLPEELARLIIKYLEDQGGGPVTILEIMTHIQAPKNKIKEQLILFQNYNVIKMNLDRKTSVRQYKLIEKKRRIRKK